MSHAPTTQYLIAPHPALAPRLQDRDVVHAAIMAACSDKNLGPNPRAKAECLWRQEPDGGALLVQSGSPIRPEVLGSEIRQEVVRFPSVAERVTLTVAISCQKSPRLPAPSPELHKILKADGGRCYRSRLAEVPEGERGEWMARRLAVRGVVVEPDSLRISPIRYAKLGRRGGAIPYVEAVCSGTVIDAALLADAMRKGVGKGRNFGLGLLRAVG